MTNQYNQSVTSLDLNGDKTIEDVDFLKECNTLISLDLSGCVNLHELKRVYFTQECRWPCKMYKTHQLGSA